MQSSSLDLQYGLIDCANGVSDAMWLFNQNANQEEHNLAEIDILLFAVTCDARRHRACPGTRINLSAEIQDKVG